MRPVGLWFRVFVLICKAFAHTATFGERRCQDVAHVVEAVQAALNALSWKLWQFIVHSWQDTSLLRLSRPKSLPRPRLSLPTSRHPDIPFSIPFRSYGMTSFLSPSRALPYQLASRTSLLGAGRGSRVKSWSRVTFKNQNVGYLSSLLQLNASTPIFKQLLTRFYATNPGKPKAHTGRVAASKRKPAAARSDAAAGIPKKAPAKKRTTRKKSAAKKPASKTKSRAKAKSKAKAKPKRKAVTTAQKAAKLKKDASQKRRNLRQQALLDPPKRLPSTAYTVLFTESSGKGIRITEHAKAISTQYKSLSPEEMEACVSHPLLVKSPLLTHLCSA